MTPKSISFLDRNQISKRTSTKSQLLSQSFIHSFFYAIFLKLKYESANCKTGNVQCAQRVHQVCLLKKIEVQSLLSMSKDLLLIMMKYVISMHTFQDT